jgi:hypothetical protein|tara:strand:+ start:547 stop:777 length:231 start_codon:yes stop_codon:yes gene_type:complete
MIFIDLVKVYPNPAQNILYITGVKGSSNIQFYAILAQLVINKSSTNILDQCQLKQSVYYIKISERKKRTQLNFIKH